MAQVSWDSFKWVVAGLLSVVTILVGVIFSTMRTDISEIRTKLDAVVTQMHADHVDLVKTISGIGGKLDQLSQDIRRH